MDPDTASARRPDELLLEHPRQYSCVEFEHSVAALATARYSVQICAQHDARLTDGAASATDPVEAIGQALDAMEDSRVATMANAPCRDRFRVGYCLAFSSEVPIDQPDRSLSSILDDLVDE